MKLKPASEMFIDSMSEGGIGSAELTCDFCGRVHLCPDSRNYKDCDDDEGFREYCENEYKLTPDKVSLHYGYDSVSGRFLDQRLYVLDCECNSLSRHENFIWENKDTIRKYLKDRIDHEYNLAQQQLTLNKLSGI